MNSRSFHAARAGIPAPIVFRVRVAVRLMTIEPLRSLARNKVRAALAMLGITVAVATVIWVVAIGRAGTEAALGELDKLGDNLVWVEAGSRNVNGVRTGTPRHEHAHRRSDAQAIRDEIPLDQGGLGEHRRPHPGHLRRPELADPVPRRSPEYLGDQALGHRARQRSSTTSRPSTPRASS